MSKASSPLSQKECVVPTPQCCLKVNTKIEHFFEKLGIFVSKYPGRILITNIIILIGLCFGLFNFQTETNIFDLWTPTDSPIFDENDFIDEYWSDKDYGLVVFAAYAKSGFDTNIMETSYIDEWYEIHLKLQANLPKKNYTYTDDDGNTKTITFGYFMEDYYEPEESLDVLANLSGSYVPHYASEVVPLCRNFATSPLEAQFELSCYMFNLLDCFTEGGYAFPYESYLQKTYFSEIISPNPYAEKPSYQGMTQTELGAALAPSCELWQGTVVPFNYIMGGEVRIDPDDETSQITSVSSFETIAFVDSPFGIARKIKIAKGECTYTSFYSIDCETPTDDEKTEAEDFLDEWLSEFIDYMGDLADEQDNDDSKLFKIVYWTPRTASDLLTEASSADFGLLGLAYGAMIVFASLVAFRPRDLFLSKSEASCCGVILVLLAVLSTMGTGAIFLKFSPNVIQVLPFIALGFGVDDMFVLLFSFRFRENLTIQQMMGECVRLAGSSVAMTSVSNFFAFLIGSTMVLPDVARFATFGMIIVVLNFFTILFGFTAVLTMTASRMSKRHLDWSWFCCFAEFTKAKKTKSERHNSQHVFDPFFDFMTNDYTRIVGFLAFWGLAGVGIYGCTLSKLGLPLADIVPDGTYASDFLTVREEFYFSYVVSLYTDADGADLKRINWGKKFGTWINLTEDIYSISDLVYTDPDVHDFWAWNMRDYLADAYESTFVPYSLSTSDEDSNTTVKEPDCETDRLLTCPFLFANYSYGSDLYDCMMYNEVLLSSNCLTYLESIAPDANATDSIAKQIQVIVADGDDVDGLYIESSQSDTNVYRKLSGVGIIYQASDYSWVLLDSNYDAKYFGPTTSDGSAPPQSGWKDASGDLQAMSTVYWDTDLIDYYRDDAIFMESDVDADTSFSFNFSFAASESNGGACYLLEAFRSSMGDVESFDMVTFESDLAESAMVACNAYYESTSICSALANEESIYNTVCGGEIEAQYRSIYNSTFWIGDCSDNGYTIVGVDSVTNITRSDGCACDDQSFSDNSIEYNFLSPCADSHWGGFGISESGSETCDSSDQEIVLTCNADSCGSLDSCISDYVKLSNNPNNTQCDLSDVQRYLNTGTFTSMIECLFDFYDSLTECCQLGLQSDFILNEAYSCSNLRTFSASAEICNLRETCDSDCNSLCYYDTNGNCADAIEKYCYSEWVAENETLFWDCILDGTVFKKAFVGQCCYAQLQTEWDDECVFPSENYWDYDSSTFNYTGLCSASEISSVGCGSSVDNTVSQMNCLINNTASLDTESCCYKAVLSATTTYSLTHDCQGDASKYKGNGDGITWGSDLDTFVLSALASQGDTTTTCSESLSYCYYDGTWPLTAVGETVTIDCEDGYTGTRSRTCGESGDSSFPEWQTVNDTMCEVAYCENDTVNNQLFERTEAYTMKFYFGNYPSVTYKQLVGNNGCEGTTFPYVQRYCKFNTTTREAEWGEVQPACRAWYGVWSATDTIIDGYCDENDEATNLVEVYDTTEDYQYEAAQLAGCQDRCVLSIDHCAGVQWNNETRKCKIYDSCIPKEYSSSELASMGVASGQITYYHATLTLNEYAAAICQAAVANAGLDESATFVSTEAWTESGIPFHECFNITLYLYFVNPAGGTLYRDKILFNDISLLYDDDGYNFENLQAVSTYNSFAVKGVDDDEVAVELILAIRDRLDEWSAEGLYVIPGGLVIELFSQYIGVEEYLVYNLLYVSICVVVTGFAFLLNWWAVVICLLCNAAMIVEVYGFVEWLGLRVNGVLVLNIVIAVGLTMEFTAHIGRSFVLTKATALDHERGVGLPFSKDGQIRMKKMYREMFNPVTMGAITTFLGVLPISLAEFPYFRQYYFVLYVVIVLFGWLNGVIFQPIFLSLLPPAPFDEEPLPEQVPLTQQNNTTDAQLIDENAQKETNEKPKDTDDKKTQEDEE